MGLSAGMSKVQKLSTGRRDCRMRSLKDRLDAILSQGNAAPE
jgi:hypothetical protein